MTTREELCRKITEVFPDVGACDMDVTVDYDDEKKAWAVELKKDEHHLRTYLEDDEARTCLEGKQCVSLGMQIGQLRRTIEEYKKSGAQ